MMVSTKTRRPIATDPAKLAGEIAQATFPGAPDAVLALGGRRGREERETTRFFAREGARALERLMQLLDALAEGAHATARKGPRAAAVRAARELGATWRGGESKRVLAHVSLKGVVGAAALATAYTPEGFASKSIGVWRRDDGRVYINYDRKGFFEVLVPHPQHPKQDRWMLNSYHRSMAAAEDAAKRLRPKTDPGRRRGALLRAPAKKKSSRA